jgi:hypothetical protein
MSRFIVAGSHRSAVLSALIGWTWSLGAAIVAHSKSLVNDRADVYRPEYHYMRGPGPKWRAKHGDSASHPR